jgi:hypothetical protein
MEKTKLTSDLFFELLGLLSLTILFTYLVFNSEYELPFEIILVLVLMFLLVGFCFNYLSKLKTIEFDDCSVYLTSKGKTDLIPLKSITEIRLLMGGINNKDFWTLKYIDINEKEKSVTFIPRTSLRELFKLQELVKANNPDAKIRNVAIG